LLPNPVVSVIIVSWNSKKYLQTCLDKLAAQTFPDFEVILVDNGSEDSALDEVQDRHRLPRLQIKKLGMQQGFAAANNIGARLASGKWLALLNSDAFPESDWLEQLLRVAERAPGYSSFSSRQIQFNAPQLLDGAGDAYHISGLAWRNGYKLAAQVHELQQKEVFSACAAAALYARENFLTVGGFDEDYFSYFEDVDLGFRLRLGGEKCLYVPEAVVHHVGSASTGNRSDFSVYHGYRNMIWTFVKNMPAPWLWVFLPLHMAAVLFFAAYLTIRGQGQAIWKAIFDAIAGLPQMMEKRKVIQKNKTIKWNELWKVMSTGVFEPLQEFLRRNQ